MIGSQSDHDPEKNTQLQINKPVVTSARHANGHTCDSHHTYLVEQPEAVSRRLLKINEFSYTRFYVRLTRYGPFFSR